MTKNSAWPLQDAETRFGELVELALTVGPQHVTCSGKPAVVVLSETDYAKARITPPRGARSLIDLMRECPAPEIFDAIEQARGAPDVGR